MEVTIVGWSQVEHRYKIRFQLTCQLHFMGKQLLSQQLVERLIEQVTEV